jgi:predicted  nucleic acid-binding Zn-ribbon protein
VSETVSLEFIGRRLDAIQADVADVRRRMIGLTDRFEGVEGKITLLSDDVRRLERRMHTLEVRMDAMVERQSKQEELLHRVLLLTEHIAKAQGISDV